MPAQQYTQSELLDRFIDKIYIEENGCWRWTGLLNDKNYAILRAKLNKTFNAHRLAYEIFRGDIPPDKITDHICHDPKTCVGGKACMHRRCVCPWHLKITTRRENGSAERSASGIINTARQRAKTECPRGHEYTSDNTYVDKKGHRNCRVCIKIYNHMPRPRNLAG